MRTYVLISLLSVIGLACCRPQEIVSSSLRLASLPVQTHFRYNSKSRRTYPIFERIALPQNKNYTLSQDILQNIENARNSYKIDRKHTLTHRISNKNSTNNNNNKHAIKNNNHKPENTNSNNNKQNPNIGNYNTNHKRKHNNTKHDNLNLVKDKITPVTPFSLKSSSLRPKISTTTPSSRWPNGQLQTNSYYNYNVQDSKNPPVRPVFTQETKKPQSDTKNTWFELKLKPPKGDTKNYDSSTPVYPSVVYPSNSYPTNPYISNQYPTGLNNNQVYVGNTVTLSPEVVSISQGTHTLAGPENNPCPAIHITNNLYNKQACQDVDVVINNHLHTESNVYGDGQEDILDPPKEGEIAEEEIQAEYDEDEEDYEEEVTEVTEEEVTSADDYVGEEDIPEEEFIPEADTPVEDAISGGSNPASDAQVASDSGGSSGLLDNLPGLPNFPNITRPSLSNDAGDDEEDDEGGLFDSGDFFSWTTLLNPFNIPLFGILAAPLTILFTGALGISTFFLPWTVLPTLFLSRKAKQNSNFVQSRPSSVHPDGWFWHSRYKTWVNMNRREDNPNTDNWADSILKMIEEYGRKYYSNYNESWKRRKKYI